MINGVINVNKEEDFTSFDVCAKLRGILHIKKIGHTGTLDPKATGVLPVCIGNATKLCDILPDHDKTYIAELLLGQVTDTEDIWGNVLNECEVHLSKEEVISTVLSFIGSYDQIPPMYSALKIDGKKLYELAREGKVVERKPRKITIYSIDILEVNIPTVRFKVSCSKGSYIRSLCRDIGEKLGCGGTMKSLVRSSACGFNIEDSYTLSDIENLVKANTFETIVTSVDKMFPDYERLHVKEESDKYLYNGNKLYSKNFIEDIDTIGNKYYLVYDSKDIFVGIYLQEEDYLKPYKMFLNA